MIRFLLALHPRAWRARYGEEFTALLESSPVTPAVVLDVLRNAARQHAASHAAAMHAATALVTSVVVEVTAVHLHLTADILWLPKTPLRGLALAALLLPWVPVATDRRLAHRRRHARLTRVG
jgi:hypothetical protein